MQSTITSIVTIKFMALRTYMCKIQAHIKNYAHKIKQAYTIKSFAQRMIQFLSRLSSNMTFLIDFQLKLKNSHQIHK